MPVNTKVHRCVDALKRKGTSGNAYAICQASTRQSFATGKPLKAGKKKKKRLADYYA